MVFENLTLVELHLENARFGPSIDTGDEETARGNRQDVNDVGRRLGPGLLALGLITGVVLAARRYLRLGADLPDSGIEEIEIDHAIEQE